MKRLRLVLLLSVLGTLIGAAAPHAASALVLTIQPSGNASGSVVDGPLLPSPGCTWDGSTSSAGGQCSISLPFFATISLTAVPATSSTSVVWTGCSRVEGRVCWVENLGVDKTISVSFGSGVGLTVTKAGTGKGRVISTPSAIDCGTACFASFVSGTVVVLTATPDPGQVVLDFTGPCTSKTATTCTVTMDATKTIGVVFGVAPVPLDLTVVVVGRGQVSSNPTGITNCATSCTATFQSNTTIVLNASPSAGYRLDRWEGCDTPSGSSCTVQLATAKTVRAVFADSVLDGGVLGCKAKRVGKKRVVTVTLDSVEPITAQIRVLRGGTTITTKSVGSGDGTRVVTITLAKRVSAGKATVEITLSDGTNTRVVRKTVTVPV